jgi:hypothetical protein
MTHFGGISHTSDSLRLKGVLQAESAAKEGFYLGMRGSIGTLNTHP